jgi:Protein of unknwon function (DUF3310)
VSEQNAQVHDSVNHPSHYCSHPSGVEAITICEHHDFCIGNALKYLWRAGLKGDDTNKFIEDLKKSVWYINRRIAFLEAQSA